MKKDGGRTEDNSHCRGEERKRRWRMRQHGVTRCDGSSWPEKRRGEKKNPTRICFSCFCRQECCYPLLYQVSTTWLCVCVLSVCVVFWYFEGMSCSISVIADRVMRRCWPTFCTGTSLQPSFPFAFDNCNLQSNTPPLSSNKPIKESFILPT